MSGHKPDNQPASQPDSQHGDPASQHDSNPGSHDPDTRQVAPGTGWSIPAYRPDPPEQPGGSRTAAGDAARDAMVAAYAAAGLSDAAIRRRIEAVLPPRAALPRTPPTTADAAWALAEHAAALDWDAERIVALLVEMADRVPWWPDDPEELASIARIVTGTSPDVDRVWAPPPDPHDDPDEDLGEVAP